MGCPWVAYRLPVGFPGIAHMGRPWVSPGRPRVARAFSAGSMDNSYAATHNIVPTMQPAAKIA